jgi:hypothetical protein
MLFSSTYIMKIPPWVSRTSRYLKCLVKVLLEGYVVVFAATFVYNLVGKGVFGADATEPKYLRNEGTFHLLQSRWLIRCIRYWTKPKWHGGSKLNTLRQSDVLWKTWSTHLLCRYWIPVSCSTAH